MSRPVVLAFAIFVLAGGGGLGCVEKAPSAFDAGVRVDAGDFDAGDPEACQAVVAEPPAIVFGSGESIWREVADGDRVPFVRGPQDGYHFYGAVKEKGIATSGNAIVAFAVFDGERQINDGLGVYARPDQWETVGDGWQATVGHYVILEIEGPGEVDGHSVCVLSRVTDADGTAYLDQRTISLYYEGDA